MTLNNENCMTEELNGQIISGNICRLLVDISVFSHLLSQNRNKKVAIRNIIFRVELCVRALLTLYNITVTS
jgi:hypothetical protein